MKQLFIWGTCLLPLFMGAESDNFADKSFDYIKQAYNAEQAWGLHATIDLKECDPDLIRSAGAIKEFVIKLCELIDMHRYGEPIIVHFGREKCVEGYTLVQLIETSDITAHFANETNSAYIDIFSCKVYDPHKAAEFCASFFKPKRYEINVLLRK